MVAGNFLQPGEYVRMATNAHLEYISIGGNRHPSAADWSSAFGGLLAYGAGNSIALWNPLASNRGGVVALLNGHTDTVNAVRFLQGANEETITISGSADKTLRAWEISRETLQTGELHSVILGHHDAGITTIDISPNSEIVVSGSADCIIKIWRTPVLQPDTTSDNSLLETIKLKVMPLAIAIHPFNDSHCVLAVAGSHSTIHVYTTQKNKSSKHIAALAGHAGWIRALSFTKEHDDKPSDLLLASASQDKFIRLWRVHLGDDNLSNTATKAVDDPSLGVIGRSISTKVHRFSIGSDNADHDEEVAASITFEALLLGHEDWIYTAKWHRRNNGNLQLLSASADSSLAIWESDAQSGIWVCISRLGEISAQKGSTTATGSTGGFWMGLWAPDGDAVVSLGRTGNWRVWVPQDEETWTQSVGCGGHVRSVNDIAWTRDGGYLLSTSADQTTRLHAEWKRAQDKTWHEFARPQIHGYDLNCVDTISSSKFVSGADEKPIRVFEEPASVASILSDFCGIDEPLTGLPQAANIPVLGLSNKEIDSAEPDQQSNGDSTFQSVLSKTQPPIEDDLARHLLYPEIHKVYGHGLEISALSVSQPITIDGEQRQILASACRASSLDHAVIRLHDTTTWREYAPPLKAHTLTVTSLQWSPDAKYLLSTSRDRMFSIFEHFANASENTDRMRTISHVKGHSRMILGCAWASFESERTFVTAGRDKCIKVWSLDESAPDKCTLLSTVTTSLPVTAVAIAPRNEETTSHSTIAAGLEDGSILLISSSTGGTAAEYDVRSLSRAICPTKAITKLSWRPAQSTTDTNHDVLAAAGEDCSLRIISLR